MVLLPEFSVFSAKYDAGQAQLMSQRVIADLDTPVSLFAKICQDERNTFILESVTGGENSARYSILGLRPDLIFRASDKLAEINRNALYQDQFEPMQLAPIEALQSLIEEIHIPDLPVDLPAPAAGLFGYLSYDVIRRIEPLGEPNPDPIGTPDFMFMRPTIVVVVDRVKHEVILCTPIRPRKDMGAKAAYEIASERIRNVLDKINTAMPSTHIMDYPKSNSETQCNVSRAEYLDMVRRAKDYILAGDIFQVVLSQRWHKQFDLPPLALYRALRRTNPSPYMFYFEFGDFQVIGASPEILVNKTGQQITIRPIAGTRPRGDKPAEDKALELDLLSDKKELAEHLMLLDLGRNDVGRVAKIGTVKPTEEFIVERYSHVMHIVSNVVGELDENRTALDALLSGMPAGTLSGAPKVRAMQIIDELEPEKRGIYGGGVGYFAANGDMDICIALRTAILKKKMLYVQAGAGIVYDSEPESEFQECVHKSKALFTAAQEAHLFVGRSKQ